MGEAQWAILPVAVVFNHRLHKLSRTVAFQYSNVLAISVLLVTFNPVAKK